MAKNDRNVHNALAKALNKMGGMFVSYVGKRSLFLELATLPRSLGEAGSPENLTFLSPFNLHFPVQQ